MVRTFKTNRAFTIINNNFKEKYSEFSIAFIYSFIIFIKFKKSIVFFGLLKVFLSLDNF
ncbi:hypothetical protein AGMMS50249_3300 [candidate division SR1 bacterium]|nr:hypothetical protein AGMMS50249_3300 [candidate division SR1 bacterium]